MNRPIQNVVGYYIPSALHFSQVPLEVEVEVETHRRKEKKWAEILHHPAESFLAMISLFILALLNECRKRSPERVDWSLKKK